MTVEAIWCTYFGQICFNKKAMINKKNLSILYINYGSLNNFFLPPIQLIRNTFPIAPLSVCPTTCSGFSGSNTLGSHCLKNLNLKGLFISMLGGVYCMIYGQIERYHFI